MRKVVTNTIVKPVVILMFFFLVACQTGVEGPGPTSGFNNDPVNAGFNPGTPVGSPGSGDPVDQVSPAPDNTVMAYQQDQGNSGLISIESENFDTNTSRDIFSWEETFNVGQSGSATMQATPNNGKGISVDYSSLSPQLDYKINFVQTGIHYIWARGYSDTFNDDSFHIGLNGQENATSSRISNFSAALTWSNLTMDNAVATIDVTTTGMHTLNVWMREDGFILDKIIITTDPTYIPAVMGETESTRALATVSSPIISSNVDVMNSSKIITLTSITSKASIYYTTDGTEPTVNDSVYVSPLTITSDTTIKAFAVLTDYKDSQIVSADMIIADNQQPVNHIPVAINDSVMVEMNQTASINVLSNDSGLNDGSIQVAVLSPSANGTTTIEADNTVTYVPNTDYNGSDSFSYQVTDKNNDMATATVMIEITCATCLTPTTLSLAWNTNPDQINGYRVYFGDSATTANNMMLETPTNIAQFDAQSDLLLQAGDTACFRISAFNGAGESGLSTAVCTTI